MKKQIITFLEAYITVWDFSAPLENREFSHLPALTDLLNAFCEQHNLPPNMSADDLLTEYRRYLYFCDCNEGQKPLFENWMMDSTDYDNVIAERIEKRKPDMDRDQYGQIYRYNYQVERLFNDDKVLMNSILAFLKSGKSKNFRLDDFFNKFGQYKAIVKN